MWTDQQFENLQKFAETDDTTYLYELAKNLRKDAEILLKRAKSIELMAKKFDDARKKR